MTARFADPAFDSLRAAAPAPGDGVRLRTFLAVAELGRFLPLRSRIGYTRANDLMAQVAERIGTTCPELTIGRVGRSTIEFAFGAADRGTAEATLDAIAATIEQRLEVDGIEFTLPAMIGAVDLGTDAIEDASVDVATAALAEARRLHRRVLIVENSALPAQSVDDLTLLREMPEAMRSGALQVHYQPKLRVRTNRIDSVEALIRWQHPVIGAVAIEPFVRLAEETGAIRRLTEWVIARAVLDRAMLSAAGHEITIWVNLSGLLLPDAGFTTRALELIEGSGGGLGFEITETAVIESPERAMANLAAFSAAGVKIAIDDYGSGLSSLAYLKQLPADELKIDRFFIKELVDSHRDPLLVRSSIDLGHALEMEVTAEGVDDPMALSLLKIMGCDMVQGYLISRPVPVSGLVEVLRNVAHLEDLTAPRPLREWRTA